MRRVMMDVDTGIDDALALALAVRHPGIELEGVLTVAGNVDLQQTTRNTLRVLDFLGATDVPVARGAARPLEGRFDDARRWHGPDGLGGADLPESRRDARDDAIAFLIERVMAAPGELTLICTAPLTNLALALQREPRIAQAVRDVVVMGGAAAVPGNVTPVAEFNIHADPLAAQRVFDQPWRTTLVGLDVTSHALLTRADRDATAHQSSPEARLVREVTRHIFDDRKLDRVVLHDALAVGVAIEPDLVSTVDRDVHVETRGEHTRGQTVVDLRSEVQGGTQTGRSRVCLSVDAARFKALFERTLGLSDC